MFVVKICDTMTIFTVENYILKPDKLGEFLEHRKKWEAWKQENPELCKEMKSSKFFSQLPTGIIGGYVEMTEFENLAEMEKFTNKLAKSDYMTKFYPDWLNFLVPGTYSMNIWRSVP